MSLPENTNPAFLAWLNAQKQAVQNDVNAYWDAHADDDRLFPGHKSSEYARLTFLIQYCRETYGYA